MFYFYFESRSEDSSKDPLVLWMTGGPGCSSELAVFYGAFIHPEVGWFGHWIYLIPVRFQYRCQINAVDIFVQLCKYCKLVGQSSNLTPWECMQTESIAKHRLPNARVLEFFEVS
jgi:Serine carboxypeptidase